MRGPGLRVLCDVRRTWECPMCGYRRHVPQTETAVRCQCSKDQPFMKLVEGLRKVRAERSPLDPYLEFDAEELNATVLKTNPKPEQPNAPAIEETESPIPEDSTPEPEPSESTPSDADESDAELAEAEASTDEGDDGDAEASKPKRRKRGRRRRKKRKNSGGDADAGSPPPSA